MVLWLYIGANEDTDGWEARHDEENKEEDENEQEGDGGWTRCEALLRKRQVK